MNDVGKFPELSEALTTSVIAGEIVGEKGGWNGESRRHVTGRLSFRSIVTSSSLRGENDSDNAPMSR